MEPQPGQRQVVGGPTMDGDWNTTCTGRELASADIRPGAARSGTFSCGADGTTFTRLGPDRPMGNDRRFFTGHRFALFNHTTRALGGSVRVTGFEPSTP
ncbi:hypothetical protein [Streptomyces sp. enrichment culture]|uniref:hypothetical protein n=1 Tax=Streptomyces sp. enrichment culture TaxID=1795815 RepID=UPI003F56C0B5